MFTKTKIKAFNAGVMNLAVPPSSKKEEEENRKKQEEEETAQVYQEFIQTFEETSKVSKTWVKGGTVIPGSASGNSEGAGRLYKPTSKYNDPQKKKEIDKDRKDDERKRSDMKPLLPGRKREQEKKKSNLEIFKEELKAIQEQREQRHHSKRSTSNNLDRVEQTDSSRKSRFDPGLSGAPGRSLGGGIAPPNDLDYPYDFDVDKSTTNLFLGNINPQMTETQLCEIFGYYGPLASVKIMWPRTEEERARGRNCGFVAFMNRKDGERALDKLRGKEIMTFEMKLGWGKSVPIPPHPIYVPPSLTELIKPPAPSNLPFNAQPRDWLRSIRGVLKDRAGSRSRGGITKLGEFGESTERKPFDMGRMSNEDLEYTLREAVVKVVIPTERSVLSLINRMVEFVVREGPMFEAIIMNREMNNPQYKFLFDYKSPEHVYYRWKLYSIIHGDSSNRWRINEFRMYENGAMWRPPPMDVYTSGMPEELVNDDDLPPSLSFIGEDVKTTNEDTRSNGSEEGQDISVPRRGGGLSDNQKERLEVMLRELEPERQKIGEVMCWCLEHADAADAIAESIADALAVLQTPLTKKVARLFLASDILFNSSAKVHNASFFRKCFESRLHEIFKDLNEYYQAIESRLKAEQFKQKVIQCFRAWEDWAIYPNDTLIKLQNVFLGLVPEEEPSPRRSTSESPTEDPLLDGKPLVDYDGDPLDLDGVPLSGGDVDDLDGEPLGGSNGKSGRRSRSRSPMSEKDMKSGALFVPSKWESVDPAAEIVATSRWETVAGDEDEGNGNDSDSDGASPNSYREDGELDEDVDGKPLVLVSYDDDGSSTPGGQHSETSSQITEERRAKLREIEVKVMKYQDELEAGRKSSKSSSVNLADLVERYRQKLLGDEEESELTGLPSSSSARRDSSSKSSSRDHHHHHSSKRSAGSTSIAESRSKTSRSSKQRRSRSRSRGEESSSATPSSSTTGVRSSVRSVVAGNREGRLGNTDTPVVSSSVERRVASVASSVKKPSSSSSSSKNRRRSPDNSYRRKSRSRSRSPHSSSKSSSRHKNSTSSSSKRK